MTYCYPATSLLRSPVLPVAGGRQDAPTCTAPSSNRSRAGGASPAGLDLEGTGAEIWHCDDWDDDLDCGSRPGGVWESERERPGQARPGQGGGFEQLGCEFRSGVIYQSAIIKMMERR